MTPRLPLYSKILFLAFLNLVLLGLVFSVFVSMQFRMDAGSFLLAPAQNRIMAVAHTLALELDETPDSGWDKLLEKYSQANGVTFYLYDEDGEAAAGPELKLPTEVLVRIPRNVRRPRPVQDQPREKRPPMPPLFLIATKEPTQYWAGVRVPVRREKQDRPKPGTLIMMAPSLASSQLFFDPKPWLAAGVSVILVSVICWLPFIRGLTKSISQLTAASEKIAEGQFEIHVDAKRRDEIGQLGEAVNRMASRLSGFVNGQKRFLGGIAHELCNPIATIQFALGNLERKAPDDQKENVADIQEEVQHMSALVNELLSFSRAGIAGIDVKLGEVNLRSVVDRAIEREATAESAIVAVVDDNISVIAEPEYLFRAISNLIRNAIRYAGHAGQISITGTAYGDKVFVTVADQGPGVPPDAVEEIFTPFYRLDPSRNEETGGVGLGLAIVKSCVESCRGTVKCRNRKPHGLEVEIELEKAP